MAAPSLNQRGDIDLLAGESPGEDPQMLASKRMSQCSAQMSAQMSMQVNSVVETLVQMDAEEVDEVEKMIAILKEKNQRLTGARGEQSAIVSGMLQSASRGAGRNTIMMEVAEKGLDIEKEKNLWKTRAKIAVVIGILVAILVFGVQFVINYAVNEVTKEVRATQGGVLQTASGEDALVGSSDMKVCSDGELCGRGDSELGQSISTSGASINISFHQLSVIAQNSTLLDPLLGNLYATAHRTINGQIEQSSVFKAEGSDGTVYLTLSSDSSSKASFTITDSMATYKDQSQSFNTSGQVFVRITSTSQRACHEVRALQAQGALTSSTAPWVATGVHLEADKNGAKEDNEECADHMLEEYSKDGVDLVLSKRLGQRTNVTDAICDLECQSADQCKSSPGFCTSATFREKDIEDRLVMLAFACENVVPFETLAQDSEDDLNHELHEDAVRRLSAQGLQQWLPAPPKPRRTNETRLGRRLLFANYGCCSTNLVGWKILGQGDTANCRGTYGGTWGGGHRTPYRPYSRSGSGFGTHLSDNCCWKHDMCLTDDGSTSSLWGHGWSPQNCEINGCEQACHHPAAVCAWNARVSLSHGCGRRRSSWGWSYWRCKMGNAGYNGIAVAVAVALEGRHRTGL